MSGVRRFEEIVAWQKARVLMRECYSVCSTGRLATNFAVRDQLCRAALSAMTNIAEGFARNTHRDFAHFLDIARGSAIEVQSLLYAALDIDHIDEPTFDRLYRLADETASLTAGLAAYLRRR